MLFSLIFLYNLTSTQDTYSLGGDFNFVTDATKRAKFVADAVTLIEDYGFDGIDIDFEFPDAKSAQGFADLNTEVRAALDDLKTKKGDTEPYYLSVRDTVNRNLTRANHTATGCGFSGCR